MSLVSTRPAPLSRDAVLGAARTLIASDGLDALSLRRVGASLGVSAPALYAYVDNKSDLLRGVAELEFESLLDEFARLGDRDAIGRIRGHAHAYIAHARAHPALFQVMFLFRPGWAPQAVADDLPVATKAFALAGAAIEEAMDSGQLRRADPFVTAMALWAAAHGTATVLLSGLDLGDVLESQIVDAVVDNLLRGLADPID